jgi:hypothetical protein
MRLFFVLLVGTAWAKVGPWGEDPSKVPPFAPTEERRAPKVPAGDKLWKEFQTDRERERYEDSLMVCLVEIGPHIDKAGRVMGDIATLGLGELANADATLRFKFRKEPTIVLWGPRKHNAFYISVPAVAIARGDKLELSMVDRGLFGNKPLGHASLIWDAHSPFELTNDKWVARCTLLDPEETMARAKPWIESVDRLMAEVLGAKVDPSQNNFGRPGEAISQLQGRFRDLFTHEGNFRYAAGFLGWTHPEIQSRLVAFKKAMDDFDGEAAKVVASLLAEAPRGPITFEGRSLQLSKKGGAILVKVGDGENCAAFADLLGAASLIDDKGYFLHTNAKLVGKNGKCEEETHGALHGSFGNNTHARLLRLPDGRFARLE